ncbi:N-acetyltransferase family protein [Acinetobacter sp. S40]|uniref:GNAT family N-acetyltransferase n=1 Tax=Acinetobacter sp. S40 TaxID=2767434 RepID=UPI00190B9698|nr:GNAT family N-acetyltransferase [Acinetobacter sp. S40]MBJ9985912.1 N-acetyltransferase family protein [Acinetobacter sp. S40]
MEYNIINCNYEKHAKSILEILNDAIENSTALYDYKKRSLSSMINWFEQKQSNNYPIIGLEKSNGELIAFGSYGAFRNWPAYKYSVEHSIYIHKDYRGHGLGHILLESLIKSAQSNNYHVMIGGIDATNKGSIALHEKHGFQHVGTLPEVGYKFGRWLDLAFYQLTLNTPNTPNEE